MNYTKEATELLTQIATKMRTGEEPSEIIAYVNQYLQNLVEGFQDTIEIDVNELGNRGNN